MAELSSPAHNWRRLDGVDLLRGAAIFFVLLNHVNMRLIIGHVAYGEFLPRQLLATLVWSAQYGVQMFFSVSGFLITSTSLRRWGALADVHPRAFYLLRFARIGPLLFLLLALLVVLHVTHTPSFVVPDDVGGLGRALFAALTFHINVLEAQRGYLPGAWDVLWSLSVEEAFYLFFPLACLWLGRGRWLVILLMTFVIVGPLARTALVNNNEVWREYSYLGGMDAIAMGCLTALALSRAHLSRAGLLAAKAVGLALLVLVLGFSLAVEHLGLRRAGLDMSVVALGTCLFIASRAPAKSRLMVLARPWIWLGQRSYEIYLTHMFVVIGLFAIFARLGKSLDVVPGLFIASVAAAAILGGLVARFYSEPMNRYLRRRWGEESAQLGSVVEANQSESAPS